MSIKNSTSIKNVRLLNLKRLQTRVNQNFVSLLKTIHYHRRDTKFTTKTKKK